MEWISVTQFLYYSGNFADLSRMISHRKSKDATQFFVYALTKRQQHDFFKDIVTNTTSGITLAQATFATLPLSVITHQIAVNNKDFDLRLHLTCTIHYRTLFSIAIEQMQVVDKKLFLSPF